METAAPNDLLLAGDRVTVTRPVVGTKLQGREGEIIKMSAPSPNQTATVRLDRVDHWTPAVTLAFFVPELDRPEHRP